VTHFYHDDEPLIFDENYGRKESYYGVREALQTLIPGGTVGGEGVLIAADVDIHGNEWGHLWMQPEPASYAEETAGDARPDWERLNSDAGDSTDDDIGNVGTDDEDLPPIF
jgi:hypothetical protein